MILTSKSTQAFLLLFSTLAMLVLVWYGAAGLRGTDQYWYVADVEKLVNNEPLSTNTYFPGVMLRSNVVLDDNPILHNSPMLYVVAFVASALPVYESWIAVNLALHIFVAICIYSLSRKYTRADLAAVVTAFYLLSPIAIWQTINPLLEMYYAGLVLSLIHI